MEDTYNIKAIVLNRKSYAECDSRVVVYSLESGKLELVARGAKKIKSKSAGHLEPLNLADIMVVRGRKYDYAGAAISEECHSNIKSDLAKLTAVGRAVKAVDQLIKPGIADEEIFALLKDYLEALDAAKKNYEIFTSLFIFKILVTLGHKPELFFCVSCVNKIKSGKNRFDLSRGGLVCEKCLDLKNADQIFISDDVIKLLRLAFKLDFKQLDKVKISKKLSEETEGIIDKFYRYSF